ncbi:MAG TPA: iron-containing alcohol dehydrogenase [Leptospiraceae bacterium]|nr:iron-containing alcohol dehydrogenase [Leptospiraceae bacterium]HMX54980.1 iron-containing alcohol dehydrogenase [Leptospiraceae bacterium]HNE23461.1 iron-containing alcohol dehydrogenase [Leptospiraceae bacterium]HNJ02757.1 iron-containing alcohol dehydrogenase [Leptospiraceae bacterium]HNJ36327.1 iron-containing alcohol dehydrogenase [Leptospiraceae bacterium]
MFEWVHYQFPARIFIEKNATHKIGTLVKEVGSRALLVALKSEMSNPDELAVIKTSLDKYTSGCILYDDMASRPGNKELDTAAHFAKQSRADIIIGYGGRDSFHAAKAIALLCKNDVFAEDLPHTALPLKRAPLPVAQVPAAPSMGEETSPVFSVYNPETRSAFFSQDYRLFPAIIFVDPNITSTLSKGELSRAGAANVAAAVESILSRRANDITTSIALRSLDLVQKNLQQVMKEPGNMAARTNVSLASVLCGMAHSNSMLGLCYSIASATSLLTGLEFHLAMALLLPHVMEYNLTTSAGRYVQIARALDEDIKDITVIEAAIKAVEGVRKTYLELKIPQRLSEFEIAKEDLPEIAELAFRIPMVKNSPRDLDKNEIETILIAAY